MPDRLQLPDDRRQPCTRCGATGYSDANACPVCDASRCDQCGVYIEELGSWVCRECVPAALEMAEDNLPCECVNTTGRWDLEESVDVRNCPAHGPHSPAARRERELEAAEEAKYWSRPGWAEVFKPYLVTTSVRFPDGCDSEDD